MCRRKYFWPTGPAALAVSVLIAAAAHAADDKPAVDAAIVRGLDFLKRDALAWNEQHGCASCHHAALMVWAMHEARRGGYGVDEPVLADLTRQTAESGDGKTSLPRPEAAPAALNTKPVWFALGLGAVDRPEAAVSGGMRKLLATVQADQTADGSWTAWPETRPPMFANSDACATALAVLAVLPAADDDPAARAVRDKGIAWLARADADDGELQTLVVRLIVWQRMKKPESERSALSRRLVERQNADGGWSQTKQMPSDAWATGQALYALAQATDDLDKASLARGRAFLVRTQRDDGSWPMTSRPLKPGGKGSESLIPIAGAGSAWGVLGLVRSGSPRATGPTDIR